MNKKIVLIITILVIIFAGLMLVMRFSSDEDTWICENNNWVKHGNPSVPAPESGCGTEITFSKTGNITNFDTTTQKESQSWRFLYEEPGAPALSIVFTLLRDCKFYFGETSMPCLDAPFSNGQRVKMEGRITKGAFEALEVVRITEVPATQIANPASVYCEAQGGKVEIKKAADGSEAGWCVFNDGRTCDEWEFFRSQTCVKK